VSTRVKFCGCTGWPDVADAIAAGVDAIGMIFAPSPRRIEWDAAAEIAQRIGNHAIPFGVFVDPPLEQIERARRLFPELYVQLSGEESPEFARSIGGTVVKAIHVESDASMEELEARCNRFAPALVMFDTKVAGMSGGTGARFDWSKVARLVRSRPIVIAGGLTPENVGECVRTLHPAWVDVRSGIETAGRKDVEKMQRFIAAVRENDAA
jgi:phosphoribosylanthranilate isomerase